MVDKQYGYMFDLSKLYNKTNDYNVTVRGSPGVRIVLNVCNKLVSSPKVCSGGGGACIIVGELHVVSLNDSVRRTEEFRRTAFKPFQYLIKSLTRISTKVELMLGKC